MLDPVTLTTTITACATPDDGYGVLADFLSTAQSKLTIAMCRSCKAIRSLEKVKPYNLEEIIRIQERIHNNAIIIDSSVLLVSSQNYRSAAVCAIATA